LGRPLDRSRVAFPTVQRFKTVYENLRVVEDACGDVSQLLTTMRESVSFKPSQSRSLMQVMLEWHAIGLQKGNL